MSAAAHGRISLPGFPRQTSSWHGSWRSCFGSGVALRLLAVLVLLVSAAASVLPVGIPIHARTIAVLAAGQQEANDVARVAIKQPSIQGTRWYFAPRYADPLVPPGAPRIAQFLVVLNAGATSASVTFTYYPLGRSSLLKQVNIPPGTVWSENIGTDVGATGAVAIVVSSSQPISAERITRQMLPDSTPQAVDAMPGVQAPKRQWSFAEGYTGLTYHEYLTVFNPGSEAAQVRVRFASPSPSSVRRSTPDVPLVLRVPSGGQGSLDIAAAYRAYPDKSVGLLLDSTQPVVAARTLFWGASGSIKQSHADVKSGISQPSQLWYFTGVSLAGADQSFASLVAPGLGAQAHLTIRDPDGRVVQSLDTQVASGRRTTIRLHQTLRLKGLVTVTIQADHPIVAELAQYVGGSPNKAMHAGDVIDGASSLMRYAHLPYMDGSVHAAAQVDIFNPGAAIVSLILRGYNAAGQQAMTKMLVDPGHSVRYAMARLGLGGDLLGATLTAEQGGFVAAAQSSAQGATEFVSVGAVPLVQPVPPSGQTGTATPPTTGQPPQSSVTSTSSATPSATTSPLPAIPTTTATSTVISTSPSGSFGSQSPSHHPTATGTAISSAAGTMTATSTKTATATVERIATGTGTATPTATTSATITATASGTSPPSATRSSTPTSTATRTVVPVSSATVTASSTATGTPTVSPTSSRVPVTTATSTSTTTTATETETSTSSATATITPSETSVPSRTATALLTGTSTGTATGTNTSTASVTTTATSTGTVTPTLTASSTQTATSTTTSTVTATATATATSAGTPPTIAGILPADGITVSQPISISAHIAPPTGQTIVSWTVSYQGQHQIAPTVVASGHGAPPTALATFDPASLPNDTYTISITATASGGGRQTTTVTVSVIGTLKRGHYVTTFKDLDVPVNGFQMQVLRTYDSIDTSPGDFGAGWRLSLVNFRITPNRVLGAGGWVQYTTGCFIFCTVAYKNVSARFVSVTFPDQHTEIFDFTPQGGVNLFNQATAAFTARPNTDTTSTLEVAGDNSLTYRANGDLDSGNILSGDLQPFDPRQFKLTTRDGRVFILDSTTGLVSETDPNGNSVQVTADGVTASNGASIAFTRDSAGRITQITGPSGQVLHYTYSAAGDLVGVIDADGHQSTFVYDANHFLLKMFGPGGTLFRALRYDANGHLTAITDANGHTYTIGTSPDGRQQTFTDPLGKLTTIDSYDALGDLTQRQDIFDGHTTTETYTYDAVGNPLSYTDPLGHTTRVAYDSSGNVTQLTDALGHTTTYTYNQFGEVLTQTAADGTLVASYTYDASGNPTSYQKADGSTFTYSYDSAGHRTAVTDPAGRVERFGYDAAGHPNMLTDAAGQVTHFTSNASGQVTAVVEPGGATTTLAYDGMGNLASVTDPAGHARSFTYDYLGNETSVTDALGHTDRYTYDGAGNLLQSTDRNGSVIGYSYDADGQLVSRTLPGGDVTTLTYDGDGRILSVANNSTSIQYVYDAVGQLLSQTTRGTTTASRPTITLSYTYDADGARMTMSGPDGTTSYSHDAQLRTTTITDPAGGVFTFGYSPLSQLTSLGRPNGIVDSLSYDSAGNLLSRVAKLNAGVVAGVSYTYDALGRRTSQTDASGTHTFAYDLLDRLSTASHPAGSGVANEAYTYDAAGNRISSALSVAYTYDQANRLTSDAQFSYQYDNEGSLIARTNRSSGAAATFTWDALNELRAIHYSDGTTTTYRYDPYGRRIEVDDAGTITRYVYDGPNIHLEYNGSNQISASYTTNQAADSVLEMVRGGQPYYYLQDGLGSTTALTDAAGHIAARYAYDAFGRPKVTGSLTNPFTFTGREYDAKSGLYYYRARYYDPGTGRFLSEDPKPAINPYPYTSNNPINQVDPTGCQADVEYAETEVYVVEDASGKCYFGITKQKLAKRFYQHLRSGKNLVGGGLTSLGGFTRAVARQIEGALIGLAGGPGGQLLNKIGSAAGGPLSDAELVDEIYDLLSTISDVCPGLVF